MEIIELITVSWRFRAYSEEKPLEYAQLILNGGLADHIGSRGEHSKIEEIDKQRRTG